MGNCMAITRVGIAGHPSVDHPKREKLHQVVAEPDRLGQKSVYGIPNIIYHISSSLKIKF